MRKDLFVDSGGWMACADSSDPLHSASVQSRDEWLERGGRLLTTDYVVDESLTLLRVRLDLRAAKKWWSAVSASARVRIHHLDGDCLEAARAIFFRYADKDFSFTDCTSFALMRRLRLRQVLTTDHHFTQAGFRRLPEPD
jgi:predicted nucleic acid-binding protein